MAHKITYNKAGVFALKPPKPHEYPEWRIRPQWNDRGECCYYAFDGAYFKARLYIDNAGIPRMRDIDVSEGVEYRLGSETASPRLCAVKSANQAFMFSWDAEEKWPSWREMNGR